MTRITISERAATALNGWATALNEGSMSVDDLPVEVAAIFRLGAASVTAEKRVAELEAEVRRLNHEADLLYMAAFTSTELQAHYDDRLEALYLRDEELISQGIDPETLSFDEVTEEAAFVLGKDCKDLNAVDVLREWIRAHYDCDLDTGRYTRRAETSHP